jgi:Flagellar biosynthesis protein, FliO
MTSQAWTIPASAWWLRTRCWWGRSWWGRSWWRRITRLGGSAPRRLRLTETLPLGERRFVAVLEFDGSRFLLGGTASSLVLLARLDQGCRDQGCRDRGQQDHGQQDQEGHNIGERASEAGAARAVEAGRS